MTVLPSIHRVVTCFIIQQHKQQLSPTIAIFHRCSTMPTFPSYWAGISGTIEENETPFEAAQRELDEEVSLKNNTTTTILKVQERGGLYVDVPIIRKKPNLNDNNDKNENTKKESATKTKIIRVYPFIVELPKSLSLPKLKLLGTEHDTYKFVSLSELKSLESQCVPGLVQAFHHATFGKYYDDYDNNNHNDDDPSTVCKTKETAITSLSNSVHEWGSDKENGASVMASNALALLKKLDEEQQQPISSQKDVTTTNMLISKVARHISMIRPTMVPIVNIMNEVIDQSNNNNNIQEGTANEESTISVVDSVSSILQVELDRSIIEGQSALRSLYESLVDKSNSPSSPQRSFTIATFSRSGTIAKILRPLLLGSTSSSRTDGGKNECFCDHVICAKSTPGDEGVLMAQDLLSSLSSSATTATTATTTSSTTNKVATIECLDDEEFLKQLSSNMDIDVVLIGSDCILSNGDVVNKIGTTKLCTIAKQNNIPVYCCSDRWKVWNDIFLPSLEEDLFELVPNSLIDRNLVPSSPSKL